MRAITAVAALGAAFLVIGARAVSGQATSAQSSDLVREYARGFLSKSDAVPEARMKDGCLSLPTVEPSAGGLDDGPHGDSLVATRCEVVSYHPLASAPGGPWFVAEYRLTSVYTPLSPLSRDKPRVQSERDTVVHGEVVLLVRAGAGQVRPVWHQLFDHTLIRSMTIDVAPAMRGATLLSVQSCVNGTGGCAQEFLRRAPNGRWGPVAQTWLRQLPRGFADRIQHGFRVDPRTLRGEAALYDEHDANCCPSNTLNLWLRLRGDSLVLDRQTVTRTR